MTLIRCLANLFDGLYDVLVVRNTLDLASALVEATASLFALLKSATLFSCAV